MRSDRPLSPEDRAVNACIARRALFLVATLAVGCRAGPPASGASDQGSAEAGGQSGHETPPAFPVGRVEVPGLFLDDYQAWAAPTSAHPRGTIVALAYPETVWEAPLLVEIDVATATAVHGGFALCTSANDGRILP